LEHATRFLLPASRAADGSFLVFLPGS